MPRLSETKRSKKLTDLQRGRTLALQTFALIVLGLNRVRPEGTESQKLGTASEHEAHVHSVYRFILFVFILNHCNLILLTSVAVLNRAGRQQNKIWPNLTAEEGKN